MKIYTIGILIFLFFYGCTKNNLQGKTIKNNKNFRTEKKIIGKYLTNATYKKNKLIKSISYDTATNKKIYDYLFNDDGIMIYSTNYFENGKIKATLEIDSLPNYYLYKEYYPNGNYKSLGGIKMVRNKPIKTSSWIFHNEDGTIYSTAEYELDKKGNELLIKENIIPKNHQIRIEKNGKIVDEKK